MKERISQTLLNGSNESNTADSNPIDAQTLSTLQDMPKDALISLIQKVCAARWGEVALMSDDDAYEAVCLKMLYAGLTEKEIWKALPPLKEWVDRRRGKAVQPVMGALKLSYEPLIIRGMLE